MEMCKPCTKAKAKQKKREKKGTREKEEQYKPGEYLQMDASSIKYKRYRGSKFWLLFVDYKTDHCWSYFLKAKDDVEDKCVKMIKWLKNKNIKVKKIQCNNAGENKMAKEACNKKELGVKFEFTAPDTPQQNGKVERKFATLYGRV